MRFAAVIFVALSTQACACEAVFPRAVENVEGQSPRTGVRIFMMPGLNTGWDAPNLRWVAVALSKAGNDLTLISLPNPVPCDWDDEGRAYREGFTQALASIVKAAPPARKTVIGGISYGGLHAMLGFVTVKGFDGWFASLPVTRIDALDEFKGAGPVAKFNPFSELGGLAAPSLLTWGAVDERVDHTLTADLSEKLPTAFGIKYPNRGHSTTPDQVDDIARWLAKTFPQ